MIAESSSGRHFGGLIRYLLHGRSGQEHARVAWTMHRNLALDDPERAAVLMRATAAQNHRVEQPVYHLIVSFDPSDRPTPETIRQVVDGLLTELKLTDHQVLIVAHRDRAHPHLHMVVNRVHPNTTRAWDRWHDHTKAERALRLLECRLGLREVDGHLHQLEGQRAPQRRPAQDLRRPPNDTPGDMSAREALRVLSAAQRIHVADLPRHLDRLEFECSRTFAADNALLDRLTQAERRVDVTSRAFYNALVAVYARAPEAMSRFDDVLYTEGSGAAIRRLRDDPTSYVELRPYARRVLFGLRQKDDETTARELLPRAVAAAQEYAVAITEYRKAWREYDPGISRVNQNEIARAETEFAAHRERVERELGRIRRIREQLQPEHVLQTRARDVIRALTTREVRFVRQAIGRTVGDSAAVLYHRRVRDMVMGRDFPDH